MCWINTPSQSIHAYFSLSSSWEWRVVVIVVRKESEREENTWSPCTCKHRICTSSLRLTLVSTVRVFEIDQERESKRRCKNLIGRVSAYLVQWVSQPRFPPLQTTVLLHVLPTRSWRIIQTCALRSRTAPCAEFNHDIWYIVVCLLKKQARSLQSRATFEDATRRLAPGRIWVSLIWLQLCEYLWQTHENMKSRLTSLRMPD